MVGCKMLMLKCAVGNGDGHEPHFKNYSELRSCINIMFIYTWCLFIYLSGEHFSAAADIFGSCSYCEIFRCQSSATTFCQCHLHNGGQNFTKCANQCKILQNVQISAKFYKMFNSVQNIHRAVQKQYVEPCQHTMIGEILQNNVHYILILMIKIFDLLLSNMIMTILSVNLNILIVKIIITMLIRII